jgi:hypothetical protein
VATPTGDGLSVTESAQVGNASAIDKINPPSAEKAPAGALIRRPCRGSVGSVRASRLILQQALVGR